MSESASFEFDQLANSVDKASAALDRNAKSASNLQSVGASTQKSLNELTGLIKDLQTAAASADNISLVNLGRSFKEASKSSSEAIREMVTGVSSNLDKLEDAISKVAEGSKSKSLATYIKANTIELRKELDKATQALAAHGVEVAEEMQKQAKFMIESSMAQADGIARAGGRLKDALGGTRKTVEGHYNSLGLFITEASKQAEVAAAQANERMFSIGGDSKSSSAAARKTVDGYYNSLGLFITEASKQVEIAANLAHEKAFAIGKDSKSNSAVARKTVDGYYNSLGLFITEASKQMEVAASMANDRMFAIGTNSQAKLTEAKREVDGYYTALGTYISKRQAEVMATQAKLTANLNKVVSSGLGEGLSNASTSTFDRPRSGVAVTPYLSDSYTAAMAAMKEHYAALAPVANTAAIAIEEVTKAKQSAVSPANYLSKASKDLSTTYRQLAIDGRDLHSVTRGLTSGFGGLWLTWGELLPLLASAAFSFAAKEVIKLGSAVDHTMQTIRVLSQESSGAVEGLNKQMLELARSGPVGPEAVAEAMKTLSLAGLNASEVSASIKDVMNFAVAGTTSLKTAADVMTSVASAFGISANAYNWVGDTIAMTAAVSKSSVESIGEAFKTASVINKMYGVSLEDVGVGLAALSNLGIQGTAAGTALRNMYVDLAGRTPKVSKALKELGVDLKDEAGNFKDIISITGEFIDAFDKMSTAQEKNAISVITGERGMKPFIELMDMARKSAKEMGAEEIAALGGLEQAAKSKLNEMRTAIVESQGFAILAAAELALTPMNQIKSVTSNLQTSIVEAFNGIEPLILSLAVSLKEMFASENFVKGLSDMATLMVMLAASVAKLTTFVVEHSTAIGVLAGAYVALRLVAHGVAVAHNHLMTAKIAEMAATEASTVATVAQTGALTATATVAGTATVATSGLATAMVALSTAMKLLLPAIGLAITAWTMWDVLTSKPKNLNETYNDNLIKQLEEETNRLNSNTEAIKNNVSADEQRVKEAAVKARGVITKPIEESEARIETLQKKLEDEAAKGDKARKLIMSQYAKGIEDEKSLLTTMRVTAVEELAKLDAAIERKNIAASANRTAEAERLKKERDALTRLTGGTEVSEKPERKGPRERFQAQPDVKDSLAAIQAQAAAELAIEQHKYDTSRKLLDGQHQALMISEGTYQGQLTALLIDSEAQRKSIIEKEQNDVDYETLAAIERHKEKYRLDVENFKGSENEKANHSQAASIKLANDVAALTDRQQTAYKKNSAAIVKIEDDRLLRMEMANIHHQGKINKILEEQRLAQEKLAREDKRADKAMELARSYDMVTASSMTFLRAEKASAEAALNAGAQLEETYALTINELDKAKQSVLDFTIVMIESGKTGTKEYEDGLARMNEYVDVLTSKLEKLRVSGSAQIANAAGRAATKVADEDWAKIKQGVADSVFEGLMKGGSAGRKKLRDMIVDELTKPIRLVVTASVNLLMNSLGQLLGIGSAAGGGSGGLGSVSSMLSTGSSLNSLWGAYSGSTASTVHSGLTTASEFLGLSGPGSSSAISASNAAYANAIATGATPAEASALAGVASSTAPASSLISTISTAAPYVAAAIAAYSLLSGSFSGETRSGASYETDSTGHANVTQGPSGGEINGTATRSAIEANYTSTNDLLARLGSSDRVVQYYAGLESSDHGRGFAAAGGTLTSGAEFGEVGRHAVRYSGNLTQQQAAEALTVDMQRATLEAISMAQGIPEALKKMFEGLDIEAMTANQVSTLLSQITAVISLQDALKKLPFTYLKDISFDAANQLIKVAGGVQNLNSALGTFYNLFYSESERVANQQTTLTTHMNEIGAHMPENTANLRDWYRAEVERAGATDLSVEANARYYNSLLQLATEVDAVSRASEQAAAVHRSWEDKLALARGTVTQDDLDLRDALASTTNAATRAIILQVFAQKQLKTAVDNAQKAVTTAKTAFDRAIEAERTRLQAIVTERQTVVNTLQNIFDTLKNAIDNLYASVGSTALTNYQTGMALLDSIIATGTLPDQSHLYSAINTTTAGVNNTQYASQADADYARLVLAGKLSLIRDLTETQLTEAQKALAVANAQLTDLDLLVKRMNDMIDAANGVNVSVLSVADAVAQLEKTIKDLAAAQTAAGNRPAGTTAAGAAGAGGTATGATAAFGGGGGGAVTGHKGDGSGNFYQEFLGPNGSVQSQVVDATEIARYTSIQGGINDLLASGASFQDIAATAQYYGVTMNDIATAMGYMYTDVLNAFTAAGVPRFALGGMHEGGMRLVGEHGPELEMTGPARYYDTHTTKSLLAGSDSGDNGAKADETFSAMQLELRQLRLDNAKMLQHLTVLSDAFSGRQKMNLRVEVAT